MCNIINCNHKKEVILFYAYSVRVLMIYCLKYILKVSILLQRKIATELVNIFS